MDHWIKDPLEWWKRWFRSLPFFDPPARRLDKPSAEIASAIDAILYSDLSHEEMLLRLRPYLTVGEHARVFIKRTGLRLFVGNQFGPYPVDHYIRECGLRLVLDDLYIIHIIRRAPQRVGDIDYPQQSISTPQMIAGGYSRTYHD